MLTLKALYDPKTGLHFSEPVDFDKPIHVLVTILDNVSVMQQAINNNLLQRLNSIHQMPYVAHRSETEIEDYIQSNRNDWD